MIIRYHIDDQFVPALFPPGTSRLTADKIPPELYGRIIAGNAELLRRPGAYDQHEEDRGEYERYAIRSAQRLMQLERNQ